MNRMLLVIFGGAIGTAMRFGAVEAVKRWNPDQVGRATFPWGTLAVNLAGCLAIGVLATLFDSTWKGHADARAAVIVGILGGFTTFSSFAWETQQLLQGGRVPAAFGYIAASVLGGLALAYFGFWVARHSVPGSVS